jgi:putative solute:sodium symporter small subunit
MGNTPRQRLWKATSWLTGLALLAWLLVSLLGPWFARDLNAWQVVGFPLGFWVAGQGALVIYLLIIVAYTVRMEQLEARYRRECDAPARDSADTGEPRSSAQP